MDNVDKYVGVLGDNGYVFYKKGLDVYYMTQLCNFGGCVPIMIHKDYYEMYKGKRIAAYAFPRTTLRVEDGVRSRYVYLSCMEAEEADGEDDTKFCHVSGTLASEVKLFDEDRDRVFFEVEYKVPLHNKEMTVRLPCRAFNHAAKRMLMFHKGDPISIAGYLAGRSTKLWVVVKDIDYLGEEVIS